MNPPDKYHQSRLRGIENTLAKAQANRKTLTGMIAKVQKAFERLTENAAKLDDKISKYQTLLANVQKDPNFKMNPDDLK